MPDQPSRANEGETIVIYHGDCFDGFTSAWSHKTWRPEEHATYLPAKHGEPAPDVSGKRVYIVDFAYPRDTLLRMHGQAESILVLDHHKTAQADLEGLPFCEFDMNRSGAGITWDYFAAEGEPRHWLVDVVEDRDLWRFRFGDQTRFTMAYVATLPMTFEAWDELASAGMEDAVRQGSAIQRYIDSYGEKACREALFLPIGGVTVPVINVGYQNGSDHIDRLIKLHPTYPFAASFCLRGDGQWQFSLRSRGEFDVSAVARQYGGGGHHNASGFVAPSLPWASDASAENS